jgi:hypothetical protein
MAKVNGNLFLDRLNGSLGDQFVVKKGRGGRTIICKKPTFREDRKFSPAQLARQQAFREAAAYARTHKLNPVYIEKAQGSGKCSYNVAIGDYLHPPEILEVDLSAWSGETGQVLRIRARDDVQVKQVTVTIGDEADNVLEQGEAVEVGALWWEYTTTTTTSGNAKVILRALDLPGRATEMREVKALG